MVNRREKGKIERKMGKKEGGWERWGRNSEGGERSERGERGEREGKGEKVGEWKGGKEG